MKCWFRPERCDKRIWSKTQAVPLWPSTDVQVCSLRRVAPKLPKAGSRSRYTGKQLTYCIVLHVKIPIWRRWSKMLPVESLQELTRETAFLGISFLPTRFWESMRHHIWKSWRHNISIDHSSLSAPLQVVNRVCRSRIGGRAFSYQAPLVWNHHPVHIILRYSTNHGQRMHLST